jgi:hypothetical protein
MKKRLGKLFFSLPIIFIFAALVYASDLQAPLRDWDYYYHQYRLTGYPTFNKLFNRYDFYDLEGSYCGSLVYNPVVQDWEFKGL